MAAAGKGEAASREGRAMAAAGQGGVAMVAAGKGGVAMVDPEALLAGVQSVVARLGSAVVGMGMAVVARARVVMARAVVARAMVAAGMVVAEGRAMAAAGMVVAWAEGVMARVVAVRGAARLQRSSRHICCHIASQDRSTRNQSYVTNRMIWCLRHLGIRSLCRCRRTTLRERRAQRAPPRAMAQRSAAFAFVIALQA